MYAVYTLLPEVPDYNATLLTRVICSILHVVECGVTHSNLPIQMVLHNMYDMAGVYEGVVTHMHECEGLYSQAGDPAI